MALRILEWVVIVGIWRCEIVKTDLGWGFCGDRDLDGWRVYLHKR